MKIIHVLKKPKYFMLSVLLTIVVSVVYIYSQVLGIIENIGLWFSIIPWYNAILFSVFAVLFGITFSFQIYNWLQPKACSIGKKIGGAGGSGAGTTGLFFVAQCPACASLGALFLPVSVIGFLTEFGWLINLISIGLLLFTLNYLGAFRKE
jgi:hypothetical protein